MAGNGDEQTTDLPSAAVCDQRCQEFAAITGTDEACGHFFLQDCQWNLQTALNSFFASAEDSDEVVVADDVPAKRQKLEKLVTLDNNLASAASKSSVDDKTNATKFSIISWNVDGLDKCNLPTRTKAVCATIKKQSPDVVYLQEVVKESLEIFEKELAGSYSVLKGDVGRSACEYFIAVLVKTKSVTVESHKNTPFEQSVMGRSLMQVDCKFGTVPVHLLTSHLESTKDHATERVRQMRKCFQEFHSLANDKNLVLFAGDLNARDEEVTKADKPSCAVDVWEACGSSKSQMYTWDCLKNDNKHFPRFKPRCRFDRIYANLKKGDKGGQAQVTKFELVGTEIIRTSLCFPSDHWGILAKFEFNGEGK